ncbi:hypothetical protein Tco_1030015 [Tanacetum coccineum]|uniref:Uncharacterized protein n=1 Tax=Tanacetum coccineum TaxID=301880 RepID=A0ABQ5G6S0_9ASTR
MGDSGMGTCTLLVNKAQQCEGGGVQLGFVFCDPSSVGRRDDTERNGIGVGSVKDPMCMRCDALLLYRCWGGCVGVGSVVPQVAATVSTGISSGGHMVRALGCLSRALSPLKVEGKSDGSTNYWGVGHL